MESPSTEIQEAVALESSELLSWYRKMVEIRLAEDKIMETFLLIQIKKHLSGHWIHKLKKK